MITTKEQLEAAISWANTWSGRSTLLLVIGILGEYVVPPFLDDKNWRTKATKVIFALFVVLGIGGEYVFSSKISQGAGELQRLSDGELKQAQKDAAAAYQKAADADAQLAVTKTQATKAEQAAASARTGQQKLGIDLAKQEERAAIAEKALLELQERNKPRILNAKQQQEIADRLRLYSAQKLNLFAYSGENEIVGITNSIIMALGKNGAGWSVSVFTGNENGRAIAGVLVEVKNTATMTDRKAASALVAALKTENLEVNGPEPANTNIAQLGTGNSDPTAQIIITIGKKP